MHRVCWAWTNLIERIVTQPFSSYLLPYLRENEKLGAFQPLFKEEGFEAPSQHQSLIPYICPTRSVGAVDEIAGGRIEEMNHAVVLP